MGIQEDILRIKSLISESNKNDLEGNDFIEEYEREMKEVTPMIPEIIDFLKENLKDPRLINIESRIKSSHFGSTYWYDENGNKNFGYSTKSFEIKISVMDANVVYQQNIKKTVRGILDKYFNIDPYKYGSVIDLEYINYTPEKF